MRLVLQAQGEYKSRTTEEYADDVDELCQIQCVIPVAGEPCEWCSSQGVSCTFDRVIAKDPKKRCDLSTYGLRTL